MLPNLAQNIELILLQEFIYDAAVIQGFSTPTSLCFALLRNLTTQKRDSLTPVQAVHKPAATTPLYSPHSFLLLSFENVRSQRAKQSEE